MLRLVGDRVSVPSRLITLLLNYLSRLVVVAVLFCILVLGCGLVVAMTVAVYWRITLMRAMRLVMD